MVLVTVAAVLMALLFLLFKAFDRRRIALLPAITINYFTALACGLAVSRPWTAGDLGPLWAPALVLGALFIGVFHLMGSSAQRAGLAATTVASKMSLVLTVAFGMLFLGEAQRPLGLVGIALAIIGIVLSAWQRDGRSTQRAWALPLLLFLGNAAVDIGLAWTQRTRTTPSTEAVLPTVVFGIAGVLGVVAVVLRGEHGAFRDARTWAGGLVLGGVNYACLYFVVKALARSGMPSSSVFPLMNIGVILLGTLGGMLLFGERPQRPQLAGIATAVGAMLLILLA